MTEGIPAGFMAFVAPTITFIAGLAGGWMAHAMALSRDRRKERNDAAEPVREWLLSQIDRPSPLSRRPTAMQIDRLKQCLPRRSREKFNRAWLEVDHVRACQAQTNNEGEISFVNPDAVRAATRAVLPFTDRA